VVYEVRFGDSGDSVFVGFKLKVMPEKSSDYRIYLDERFAHLATLINANHNESMDSFERIEKKVDVTNGRVTKLEGEKVEYLKTRVDKGMFTELEKEVERIEKKLDESIQWGHHIVDTRGTYCPNAKLIHSINDELQDYRYLRKYPKLALILISLFVVGMVISAIGTVNTILTKPLVQQVDDKVNYINTPVQSRGQYYDPFAKDSI